MKRAFWNPQARPELEDVRVSRKKLYDSVSFELKVLAYLCERVQSFNDDRGETWQGDSPRRSTPREGVLP
jgi:hypothetical protein